MTNSFLPRGYHRSCENFARRRPRDLCRVHCADAGAKGCSANRRAAIAHNNLYRQCSMARHRRQACRCGVDRGGLPVSESPRALAKFHGMWVALRQMAASGLASGPTLHLLGDDGAGCGNRTIRTRSSPRRLPSADTAEPIRPSWKPNDQRSSPLKAW